MLNLLKFNTYFIPMSQNGTIHFYNNRLQNAVRASSYSVHQRYYLTQYSAKVISALWFSKGVFLILGNTTFHNSTLHFILCIPLSRYG